MYCGFSLHPAFKGTSPQEKTSKAICKMPMTDKFFIDWVRLVNLVAPRVHETLVKRQALDQVQRGTKHWKGIALIRHSTYELKQQLWWLNLSPELWTYTWHGHFFFYYHRLLCVWKSFKIIIWELFLSDERMPVPAQPVAKLTSVEFSLAIRLQCCSCDDPT